MNILFLSLLKFSSFEERNIYTDLLREFIKNKHNVYAVCPSEKRSSEKTNLRKFEDGAILTVKTFNIQKTNVIEKGIGILAIKGQFIKAIKKYFKCIKFDLILYPTPPITLYGVVKYFKKRNNARSYLLLKDIFPQNSVDLGLIKKMGLKGLIYRYFRRQEKKLYSISDRIGCMSQANVDYVLKHNTELDKEKVEIFPNCIEVNEIPLTDEEKRNVRLNYNLPLDKKIFVYGGNLGRPQGIPFIIECLKAEKDNKDIFFIMIGDGTEYSKLEEYSKESNQENLKLLHRLSSKDFYRVIASCDVGLIFLDYRFTIPNFPSRLLSYMEARLPILACTDSVTDVGKIIIEGDFGWCCQSSDVNNFASCIRIAVLDDFKKKGENSYNYLMNNYTIKGNFHKIIRLK